MVKTFQAGSKIADEIMGREFLITWVSSSFRFSIYQSACVCMSAGAKARISAPIYHGALSPVSMGDQIID